MLSDCLKCKYYHPNGCGVNPRYREDGKQMRLRLWEQPDLTFSEEELHPCPDWKHSERSNNQIEVVQTRAQAGLPSIESLEISQDVETLSMNDQEMTILRVLVEERLRVADLWNSSCV